MKRVKSGVANSLIEVDDINNIIDLCESLDIGDLVAENKEGVKKLYRVSNRSGNSLCLSYVDNEQSLVVVYSRNEHGEWSYEETQKNEMANTSLLSQIKYEYNEDDDETTIIFPKNVAPLCFYLDGTGYTYYFDYESDIVLNDYNEQVAGINWSDDYSYMYFSLSGNIEATDSDDCTFIFFNNSIYLNTYNLYHIGEVDPQVVQLKKYIAYDESVDEANFETFVVRDGDDLVMALGVKIPIMSLNHQDQLLVCPRQITLEADEWVSSGTIVVDLIEEDYVKRTGCFDSNFDYFEFHKGNDYLTLAIYFEEYVEYEGEATLWVEATDFRKSFITTGGTLD